jgi:hypothetical protein
MDTVLAEDTDERDTVLEENTQDAGVGKFSRRSVH